MNTESFPSLPEQGKNLAKFTFNVIKGGVSLNPTRTNIFSTIKQQTDRLNICKDCDAYYNGRCRECGCFLAQKVKLTVAKCPIGKW